ncbi:hypothetical protein [Staphylococcus haemolyticus]|uniref:hypothetical protein n=1 Tax=Staphylococcus haemolyticus TaxID=1283 RepID=UPI001F0AD37D|nr:hypothetical protein [Staphylococcus haemolyticus]MCH4334933.1 hypothetical protein [Staphylococcus haemolyticus]
MSTLKINHFGELEVIENNLVYFSPVTEFNNSNVTTEKLKEDYSKFMDKLNYIELLAPINEFTESGKFIEFHYHQENTAFYHTIRNLDFEKQLKYFRSIVEIANIQKTYDTQILWQIENFILSHEENDQQIRALLYEFSDDFKVYDNTDALTGLKNLILMGLTKLNNIIGKPNKADFINKSDEVIDFAESVLQAKEIDDIKSDVNNRIDIIEQRKEEERKRLEKEQEEKQKNKKFFKGKNKKHTNKNSSKNENLSPKEQIRRKLKQQYNGSTNDDQPKGKKDFSLKGIKNAMFSSTRNTILTIVLMLAVVTLVIALPSMMSGHSKDKAQAEREQKANNKLSTIYRNYINGDKEKAHQEMFALNYKDIPKKEDKNVYLDWLIEEKKYTKALDLNKNVAYKIGSNLNKDNIDSIKSINAKDNYKILTFYIADYDDKFQTVIENEKYVDLKRKDVANKLVQAYTLTNQEEELDKKIDKIRDKEGTSSKEYKNLNSAKQYYDTNSDELKDKLDEKKKASDELDKAKKEYDKAKDKDKEDKKKDVERAEDKYDHANDRYKKAYDKIVDTKPSDAIDN